MLSNIISSDELDKPIGWQILESLFDSRMGYSTFIINITEMVAQLLEDNATDETINTHVAEALKGLWIYSFMNATRKPWLVPVGLGSQADNHKPYQVLINSMQSLIKNI